MISIDKNYNIEASQYDTYTIRFKFKDYVLTSDDKFRFSIKATTNSSDVVFSKDFYNAGKDYVDVSIALGELDDLAPDTYVYDISIINKTVSKVSTLIWSAYFMIKGVAHNVD
ncbi:MAG: hypothetical protein HUJ75_00855 [Parasporobacterium sp.]|nr:hypothetical protein [Parasporobacterium sp.]